MEYSPAKRGIPACILEKWQPGRKCLKSRQSVIIVAYPLTLTLSPEAGERGFFRLPLSLGEGWGEGAFPRMDAQSCYDFWCVPSFETFSERLSYICGMQQPCSAGF
jgi:hypothetical protein